MDSVQKLASLLRSPRPEDGGLRLRLHEDALECEVEETGVGLPTVGGVPCLFADPDAEIAHWAGQLEEFDRETAKTANTVLAQLSGGEIRSDVRRRLKRLHEALELHRRDVSKVLADAGLTPAQGREARAQPSDSSARPRNPVEARLDANYLQIHRDWGWGEGAGAPAERTAALRALEAALGQDPKLGQMLVLGGGAARIPYELHRSYAERTVVIDVDVLVVTVARRILAGETIELHEFPQGPKGADDTVVHRRLGAEPSTLDAASTFHFVFADGLDPPVPDGAFDTVFTPWFIDQVPTDLAGFAPVVHRVLRPGGRWINQGPLIYEPRHTALMHRYTADEVRSIVEESGFEVTAFASERHPFLQSPASTRGRTETVLTFQAVRGAASPTKAEPSTAARPAWLDDTARPISAWPGLAAYQPPHPMFAAIIALIDGTRSAEAIAELMVERHGLPEAAALGGVQAALAEMFRSTQDVK